MKQLLNQIFSATTFIGILFFGLFLSFIIAIFFYLGDTPDYVVGATIPKYEYAKSWKLTANSGFPDGSATGTIKFETEVLPSIVFEFYDEYLTKHGWQKVETRNFFYVKRIGNTEYSVSLTPWYSLISSNNLYTWYMYIDHYDERNSWRRYE